MSRHPSKPYQHKKKFGQNFLNNSQVVERIVAVIHPQADQHLVEIGPGDAALTAPLLDRVQRLDIIEIDNDLIAPLQARFANHPAFHLHHQDALRYSYDTLSANLPEQPLRIVGNLPYNISSPLLFHLLKYQPVIQDMHFMLQKEVVERITAKPGVKHFGRLSVMLQYACQTEYIFTVSPEHFTPPPKVESAIVRLTPYTQKPFNAYNEAIFAQLVKQAFSQKRKTLRNNLKPLLSAQDIMACDLDPSIRAEAVSVAQFVRLSNFLYEQQGEAWQPT